MSEPPPSSPARLPRIAILFTQFAAYHVDRIEAAAQRLVGRAEVTGVEYAASSHRYAWERASGLKAARHITLFPDEPYEAVASARRFVAARRALKNADIVCIGVPWSRPDIVALSWHLRLAGKCIIAMTESKADDRQRGAISEAAKAFLLKAYHGAIVGGSPQKAYLRALGFDDRPIVPGYDTVSLERVRKAAADAPPLSWERRPFVCVGRLVPKKSFAGLLRGFSLYAKREGQAARPLILVGDGPLRAELEARARDLGIEERVIFRGFTDAHRTARELAGALALCLVSTTEQWGLVVNEAAALGVPALISRQVGSGHALVRHDVTGQIVDGGSDSAIAEAMATLAAREDRWQAYSDATRARADLGDVARFADAVEWLLHPHDPQVQSRIADFWQRVEAP